MTDKVITDAELINKFAEQATREPLSDVKTKAPSKPTVTLPGGFIRDGEVVKTAEVRELTGVDEEAISKASTTGKALNLLLQRGLVSIGSKEATLEDLDLLLSGDRDALLLGIRRVTFGDTVEFETGCFNCSERQVVSVNLIDDIPVRELGNKERSWVIDTKSGPVEVALPTGITQKKLLENTDKTSAEINTILLAGCVLSVNGTPSMGASTVLQLGMADRSKIVQEIIDRIPGPRLGEVVKTCKACGEDISLSLSLVDLFRV